MKQQKFGQILFIPGSKKGNYPYCNSLYIDDEKKAVIDPGSDESVLLNLHKKSPLDIIINSHYHEDHFTYNYLFPDAEFYIHKYDVSGFESLDTLMYNYGLKGDESEMFWRSFMIDYFHYEERVPARELEDGDILDFGKTKLEVIHSPGHTKGHCSFYCEDEGVLFLGDLDLSAFGPWYGDRFSDIGDTIESVKKLMEIPAEIFITSHDMGIIKGSIKELAESYLNVIDEREGRLLEFLDIPRTLDEIVDQWIIYKKPREPKEFFLVGERAMMRKQLEYSISKGRIETREDKYCLK